MIWLRIRIVVCGLCGSFVWHQSLADEWAMKEDGRWCK
jgi:hypothetical protein